MPTPAETTRRLMEDQIVRLWGRGETDLVGANYAPDIVDHMPVPGQPAGLTGMAEVVRDFRAMIPDLAMELHGTIVNGEVGCDFWTLSGHHANGAPVSFGGIDMVRTRDGRIAEIWHVEEMMQFAMQAGGEAAAFGAPTADTPSAAPAIAHAPGATAWTPDPATLAARERRTLAIAREHIEEIWAKGNAEAAHRLYAPDVIDRNPAPGQRPDVDGILDVLGWLREAVPDLSMTINAYVVEGDLAADRWTMTGTHKGAPLMGLPPLGRAFRIHGMDVIHCRADGLIDWVFHVEEFAQLRAQIG